MTGPTMPLLLYFCVVNYIDGRPILALINFTHLLGCITILILHSRHYYAGARFLLVCFGVILYGISGLFFHNGAEFFLLFILVVSLLVYDNGWQLFLIITLNVTLFLLIRFMPLHSDYMKEVEPARTRFNVIWGLGLIVLALYYFKNVYRDYQLEIEQQKNALVTLNKEKEILFSIVAHDIRGPVTSLKTILELFYSGEINADEMKLYGKDLFQKVDGLQASLDNLLRWSAGQMKGFTVQPVSFNVQPVLDEVLQLLSPSIEQKQLHVDHTVTAGLELFADKDQVEVIFRNLISNAIKFSHPRGVITIQATTGQQLATISVTDAGIGMSQETMSSLFAFQRLPAYGTKGERGTGLGLILCKVFAEVNHGSIAVNSQLKEGTTFTLTLPTQSFPVTNA